MAVLPVMEDHSYVLSSLEPFCQEVWVNLLHTAFAGCVQPHIANADCPGFALPQGVCVPTSCDKEAEKNSTIEHVHLP